MASPVSVGDGLAVLTQIIAVHDAYFDKHLNSRVQAVYFASSVKRFKKNLEQQKQQYEEWGLEYEFDESIKQTLSACRAFLRKYKQLLDPGDGGNSKVKGFLLKGQYMYEKKDVEQLQRRIDSATQQMLLENQQFQLQHQNSIQRPTLVSIPKPITPADLLLPRPATEDNIAHPSSLSTQLGVPQNVVPPRTIHIPTLGASNGQGMIDAQLSQSPPLISNGFPSSSRNEYRFNPPQPNPFTHSRNDSLSTSPGSSAIPSRTPDGVPVAEISLGSSSVSRAPSVIDMPVLPQPPKPYIVARIQFNDQEYTILRKPIGTILTGPGQKGRELTIIDEAGKKRLKHSISSRATLYPYTWHPSAKSHDPFEVTFKGPLPSDHTFATHKSVPSRQMKIRSECPRYIFTEKEDFLDFQSQVRGKELVTSIPFNKITSSSAKSGEAIEQNLKIWRTTMDGKAEHFLSFYANCEKHKDYEFPLSMLSRDLYPQSGNTVKIDFEVPGVAKRSFSNAFSRSPTMWRTPSEASTSRQNSALTSPALESTNRKRGSVASFESDVMGAPGSSAIEKTAQRMKYLQIEFASTTDATKFRTAYESAWKAQNYQPNTFLAEWDLDGVGLGLVQDQQRPESVISNASGRSITSPSRGVFDMSPELGPVRE